MHITLKKTKLTRLLALLTVLVFAMSCLGAAAASAEEEREPLSAREIYAQNVNSTVGIRTSYTTTNYWGYPTAAAAAGSGFILSEDGYILTNYHVVEKSESVTVTTYDDRSFSAKVVGYDESNDIAVLKIEAEGLTPVTFGDSDELCVGDTVAAIGNPRGELTFSMTLGIVSALGRQITLSSGTTMALIQTDTVINSGNSGGPLFNEYGEVVGITNAKFSSSGSNGTAAIENIGFAIPVNQIRGIVDSIIEYGYIVKPYLGISVVTVSEELRGFGIPQGAVVKEIRTDSPAEKAGLQINDIITAVNDKEITSSGDLVRLVAGTRPGDELSLQVYRQGESEPVVLTVTVGEQQQEALPQPTPEPETAAGGQGEQSQSGSGSEMFPFGFPFGYSFGYSG